jgi:branched-subunit amino acid ABC-type transport system permease component
MNTGFIDMTLDTFVIQLTNGLVLSLLLFLMAAGLSLIFGLMDVVNLAHGTFYLLGGYVGMSVVRWGGNFWLALLVTPVVVGGLGLVLEMTLLRRLYLRGHLDQVLFTFGAALIGTDLMRWIWGAYVETIPPPALLAGQVSIFGIAFPVYRLTMIGLGLAIAALLWLAIERTRIGAIVRAGVSDSQMVSGLGINIQLVFAGVFAVGTALAALSGVAAAPILNLYPGQPAGRHGRHIWQVAAAAVLDLRDLCYYGAGAAGETERALRSQPSRSVVQF